MLGACSLIHHSPLPPPAAPPENGAEPSANPAPTGPEAKINISYSRAGDYLSSLVVTKYSAANTIATNNKSSGTATTILFEGGVPVWQVDISKSMLSDFPGIGKATPYAIKRVKYSEVPPGFVQTTPEADPPEPLEPDHYYIFSVIRASGSTNYEAVKVQADGSLAAYEADPRAGDSFQLCCNIGPDFTVTAAGTDNSASPPEDSVDPGPEGPDSGPGGASP